MVITVLEDLDLFSYLFYSWILQIFLYTSYSTSTAYVPEDCMTRTIIEILLESSFIV